MAHKKDYKPEDILFPNQTIVQSELVHEMQSSYIDYAMSVIVGRALPDVRDGLKPVHRRILYAMYEDGLTSDKPFKKSATCVGDVLGRYHPHGDASVYDAMVRLAQDFSMRYMLVDGHGNFGSVDGDPPAAYRYTEARMSKLCNEMLRDIDTDAVDVVDNYDGEMKEPTLLPTTFPNILVSANTGIAVGMASNFCGFNLEEVCRTTIECIKNPEHDILSTMPAPDFTTGGELIYDEGEMRAIYESGRGSFKVRAKWQYDKKENLIEVTEIPYTTTIEAIIDKIAELVKTGKVREIADVRDETDLSGLKIAIDLKRGTDPEKLMARLMKLTTLQDSFSCNFNVLIGGMPRVLGVQQILEEWTSWRTECVRRRVFFELGKKKDKLHLLLGLRRILLDIDKAIAIIRGTEEDAKVIPNLMEGFDIDQIQAEFIADIRLRNINKEYILKRTQETEALENEIKKLEEIVKSKTKIRNIIVKELEQVIKKYPSERRTRIVRADKVTEFAEEDHIEDYPVLLFMTREGYFKKITPQSWRMSQDHKLKEGDEVVWSIEATNKSEIIFFTSMQQAYKARLYDFDDSKASVLGDYLPAKLGMDEGETPLYALLPGDYKGSMVVAFQNGKAARFSLQSFETKTNRRRLSGAYSDKSPAVGFFFPVDDETEITMFSTANRALTFRAGMLDIKATRSTQGVQTMVLRGKHTVTRACRTEDANLLDQARYRCRSIPSIGALLTEDQLKFE